MNGAPAGSWSLNLHVRTGDGRTAVCIVRLSIAISAKYEHRKDDWSGCYQADNYRKFRLKITLPNLETDPAITDIFEAVLLSRFSAFDNVMDMAQQHSASAISLVSMHKELSAEEIAGHAAAGAKRIGEELCCGIALSCPFPLRFDPSEWKAAIFSVHFQFVSLCFPLPVIICGKQATK